MKFREGGKSEPRTAASTEPISLRQLEAFRRAAKDCVGIWGVDEARHLVHTRTGPKVIRVHSGLLNNTGAGRYRYETEIRDPLPEEMPPQGKEG